MNRSRKIDPEINRLLDKLLVRTEQMEKRLIEIEHEVGGFDRRPRNDDSDILERRTD